MTTKSATLVLALSLTACTHAAPKQTSPATPRSKASTTTTICYYIRDLATDENGRVVASAPNPCATR